MSAIQQVMLWVSAWIPRNWLVAEYLLASNSNDTSGNGKNGTDTSVTYSWTDAAYNGTSSNTNVSSFWALTTFSTSFWINADTTSGTGSYQYPITLSENNPSWYYNFVFIYSHVTSSFQQSFTIHNSSWYQSLKITWFTLQASTWYHIVLVYSWGTGGTMSIYVNNVLNNSMTLSGAIGSSNPTLCIGADNYGWTPWNFYDWKVKKARIYNRVLNAAEISALYADS